MLHVCLLHLLQPSHTTDIPTVTGKNQRSLLSAIQVQWFTSQHPIAVHGGGGGGWVIFLSSNILLLLPGFDWPSNFSSGWGGGHKEKFKHTHTQLCMAQCVLAATSNGGPKSGKDFFKVSDNMSLRSSFLSRAKEASNLLLAIKAYTCSWMWGLAAAWKKNRIVYQLVGELATPRYFLSLDRVIFPLVEDII